MLRVLLVEDDLDLAAGIADYLMLEGMTCDHAANGVAGLQLAQKNTYEVLVLDINMPRMDGLTLCDTLRSDGDDVPVLMLTARDQLDDKVKGFAAGTDDYLVKPFAMEELLIRLRALARRRSSQARQLTVADVNLDLDACQVLRDGEPLKVTPTGLKLLECLMRQAPHPVSRDILMHFVWGDEQPDSNSLKVHMHHLRKAIDVPDRSGLIHTVPGFGFSIGSRDTDSDSENLP
ncbi:Response regulator MprA [BD1-7 clade bacterium]|uniref:Response regulator MprA n=1 Tax=BD1-7 clade bacterium TaxID=2029982 RepID=A0A5S9QWQ0_9GAMM|nr:Response regulator MprA [BD1-7 clade bacterium]